MSKTLLSRRGFIKCAGTAVLAAACSGMLTGCSGSGNSPSNETVLGDFKVKITGAKAYGLTTLEENSSSSFQYSFKVDVKLTYTGPGFTVLPFSSAFSASVVDKNGSKALTLESDGNILGADFPIIDTSYTYSPVFVTDDSEAFHAFKNDEATLYLTITLNAQTAKYAIFYDTEEKKYVIELM